MGTAGMKYYKRRIAEIKEERARAEAKAREPRLMTEGEVEEIREDARNGIPLGIIAMKYKRPYSTVCAIVSQPD